MVKKKDNELVLLPITKRDGKIEEFNSAKIVNISGGTSYSEW